MSHHCETSYYATIRTEMMREFNAMYAGTHNALRPYFSTEKIDDLKDKSEKEYVNLFPSLPYIGGKKSRDTINVIMGAIVLSIIGPLEKEELTEHQIGKVIYDTFDGYFRAKPRMIRHLIGKILTSGFIKRRMKKEIERNSGEEYRDGFITRYVDPEGEEFEFGYDFTGCALHTMFARNGASR